MPISCLKKRGNLYGIFVGMLLFFRYFVKIKTK